MSQAAREFIDGLSDEQSIAAMTVTDPVLILAGAGSGKTRTLVGRFLHLVMPTDAGGMGADASSVMMVTFTNKAAREMRERIMPVVEELKESYPKMRGGEPWIGTFHGLCLRILRVEAARAGLGQGFSIFDDSDASSLVKDVVSHMDLPSFDEDDFFKDLEFAKARLLDHKLLAIRKEDIARAETEGRKLDAMQARWKQVLGLFTSQNFVEIYGRYQDALQDQNAVDFNDLINRTTTLFREHPEVRRSWASTFRHFMVDEVQDINRAQLAWLRALTDGGREMVVEQDDNASDYASASDGMHEVNGYRLRQFPRPTIAFVGDDDQSIYGFRGSEVEVMRGMSKVFPGLTTRLLRESYRCQPDILTIANEIVGNNTDRFGKDLEPADPTRKKTPVTIERSWNAGGEIESLRERARAHIKAGGNPSEFAVLLRTREIAKFVAKSLREVGLPVVEGKASDIRKTAEVRDAMAFAGFLTNGDAETLLRRIINKPARGLGPTSIGVVGANARLKGTSFIDELRTIMNDRIDLPPEATPYKKAFINSCKDFGRLVVDLRSAIRAAPTADVALRAILEKTNYLPDLKKAALATKGLAPTPETDAMAPRQFLTFLVDQGESSRKAAKADEGAENAHEDLVDEAGRISEKARQIGNLSLLLEQASHFDSLENFMQESMLEMSQAEAAQGIQVLTIHASKGLEFDHVTLPFWVEGIMPHSRAVREGAAEIEEERRLAYVAITRARESVQITTCRSPQGVNVLRDNRLEESRFLNEILLAPEAARQDLTRSDYGKVYPTNRKTGSRRPWTPPSPRPSYAPPPVREPDNPMARFVARHAAKQEVDPDPDHDTEPAF